MSWAKKRVPSTASAVPQPQIQMYNPNQHQSTQENQWQQQQQPPPQDSWYNQQTNWQQQQSYPPQNYNQQYGEYYQNNGSYQQQQQPQQEHYDYGNVQYNQQLNTQNNVYEAESAQNDWTTSWGWGDENNSNVQKQPTPPQQQQQPQVNEEAWWTLDDQASKPEPEIPIKNLPQIERITSNRNKLETPQWSMESQMSQESSDDLLQTSESDKSRMLSRSSTISHSPISGMDNQIPEASASALASSSSPANHNFENKEVLNVHSDNKTKVRNLSVNLETLPDNSEQPDLLPLQPTARKITPPQWSENNEAPINDRNQYLETAQLSDIDTNNFNRPLESQEVDTLPPLGLRRVILGQIESNSNEPPEGLRRMIPGESSSPENALQRREDVELTRSATIGADTPPTVLVSTINRSETTIGADAVEGDDDNERPEMIEGEGELINAVRNLTVDDDDDDADIPLNQGVGVGEATHGKSSEESERGDIRIKTPERRERRYRDRDRDREKEDRDRGRARYSPSDYREKKYERKRYKDRRYEEDTDYYSDKERRQKDERDYDRKYSSLRKEKEKDKRRRDDRRDYGRDRRGDQSYYGRYGDEYENEPRSRASSRSDSMHESFRDRDRGYERDRRDKRHREKDRHRRPRDPFNPYQNFGGYDVYSYSQYYQYYETLRKTNPQAYAQLYRKYYPGDQTYTGEDRASVHSGRSSANEELAKDRYTRQSYYSQTSLHQMPGYGRGSQAHSISGHYGLDESSYSRTFDQPDHSLHYEEQQQLNSLHITQAKFTTAHIKASITSGKFVKILPNYPLDGQPAIVELSTLENLLVNDEDYQELKRFPGPLVKGTTHKKTIIEYCENKIKNAKHYTEVDYESYVLMWELLILLIRQNGMVVGADIAELLLKNRCEVSQPRPPSSVSSSIGSNVASVEATGAEILNTTAINLKEEEITKKFREYLLFGSTTEALEWAMKHGLWGHALFLASKLDNRKIYANVLMRFANGLAINDPLQTLYQLLSGKTPNAVTCVADEKWGDWRPHLAMILSNSTYRPDLNCKAITLLGDTLMSRGSLFAAQFCYLMAEVNFGEYGDIESKLVLLGANHNEQFLKFATNEAIHMTEIYEYARSLNDEEFTLATFQRYKFILSTRLADVGLLEKALLHLEKIANFIVKHPNLVDGKLINQVTHLADRLKYYDPIGDGDGYDEDYGTNRVDNLWLNNLRKVQNEVNVGLITYNSALNNLEDTTYQEQSTWQPQQPIYEYQQPLQHQQQQQQQQQQQPPQQITEQPLPENTNTNQLYWQNTQQWSDQSYQAQPEPPEQNYYSSIAQPEEILPPQQQPPQISLPNHAKQQVGPSSAELDTNLIQEKPKLSGGQEKQPISSGGGTGWFGGIFNKLSLKPKNQMKLPDDKNPTIVWDVDKKRWVNTDADGGDSINDFKPPPKMVPKTQPVAVTPLAVAPAAVPIANPEINGNLAAPNMFKMQRNRNLKKSYIDVFNPNAQQGASQTSPPPAPLDNMLPPVASSMNFFIPQPINNANAPTDFLTPAPPLQYDENSQMSRWSSASSLSREVQSYTMQNPAKFRR